MRERRLEPAKMHMKLAIVIQRYGPEITGGSEHLCRMIAERLALRHEIDVLTSCAKDYISWKNEYPEGRSVVNGVTVYRFSTKRSRNLEEFNRFSDQLYNHPHSREEELQWLEDQGPFCPGLIDFLQSMHHTYDRIIFFTYLYYPAFYGLKIAPEKSVLVPTAHNEPAIRLSIFQEVFANPYAFIYNTEAEKEFTNSLFPIHQKQEIGGIGVDIPDHIHRRIFRRKQGFIEDYFYYGGRIDAGKGCDELMDFYLRKKAKNADLPFLVLSGHLGMELPRDPAIVYVGYLSESEKFEALQGALTVFIPSVMESLSILLLESFACGTPVLVKETSPVLKNHCIQSNGGLFYNDYEEFSACLDFLLERPRLRHLMGRNGQNYVRQKYTWSHVISVYENVLNQNLNPQHATL